MLENLEIDLLIEEDCQQISKSFSDQGWHKPVEQYFKYLQEQDLGTREVLVAKVGEEFAAYLTIKWKSDYPPFYKKSIPEISDFNVLKKFQRRGIGSLLMDQAEQRISKVSKMAGIGFGVYGDYGAAQILYIKRGYIPDGKGLAKDNKSLSYGDQIEIDDSIVFYLLKELQ